MGSFPETYVVECEPLSDMWLSILEIGAVQHRVVTEIAPQQPFLCVTWRPISAVIFVAGQKLLSGIV